MPGSEESGEAVEHGVEHETAMLLDQPHRPGEKRPFRLSQHLAVVCRSTRVRAPLEATACGLRCRTPSAKFAGHNRRQPPLFEGRHARHRPK